MRGRVRLKNSNFPGFSTHTNGLLIGREQAEKVDLDHNVETIMLRSVNVWYCVDYEEVSVRWWCLDVFETQIS